MAEKQKQDIVGALTRAGAAAYLGVSIRRIDELQAGKKLKCVRIGTKPVFRIRELERFLDDLEKSQSTVAG